MIEIEKGKLDLFQVGEEGQEFEKQINGIVYYFELKNKKIITISTRLVNQMKVNNKIINFNNLKDFLENENPVVDDNFFIFPRIQLSLYVDFEKQIFLEVLVYDKSLENLYIKNYPTYKSLIDQRIELQSSIVFKPFISLGDFAFGTSEEKFKKHFNIKIDAFEGIKGKKVINITPFSFRFYESNLKDIYLDYSQYNGQILFEGLDLSKESDLKELIRQEKIVERKFHFVFPNLGLTISKDLIEFYFYDEYLVQFWQNINRPITSW